LTEAGVDLRDPKLSVTPDGRLMLLAGGSFYDGSDGPKPRRLLNARTRTSFSTDGQTWTRWQPVSLPDHEWLWRVTWHGATGYGVSYLHGVPAKDVVTTLWRTRDGLAYERVAELKPPCWPDETTLRFLPDGTMLALVRGEQADRHAFLGRSAPPYTLWTWADTGRAVQGPNFVLSPEGRLITAGRDFPNGQPQTAIGELQEGRVTPLLTLPSGGDCSYPGLGWDDGKLAVSYYSAHEGKTAIYFARVRLPGPSAK